MGIFRKRISLEDAVGVLTDQAVGVLHVVHPSRINLGAPRTRELEVLHQMLLSIPALGEIPLAQLHNAAQALLRSNMIGGFRKIVDKISVSEFDEIHANCFMECLANRGGVDSPDEVRAQFVKLRDGGATSLWVASQMEPDMIRSGNHHRVLARYLAGELCPSLSEGAPPQRQADYYSVAAGPGKDGYMFFIFINGAMASQVSGLIREFRVQM